MALVIRTNQDMGLIDPARLPEMYSEDAGLKLEIMQKLVAGSIEAIYLGAGVNVNDTVYHWMVINEEGKLKGLPLNAFATKIFRGCCNPDDVIVGVAILLQEDEMK
jgi:hypothetical protein